MSMQSQTSTSGDEMDLTDVFDLFRRWFYGLLAHMYRAIAYVFKYWWIFLLLIAVGAVLGYFTKGDPGYKASLILKTNFNSQSYVYNSIEQFNSKLSENDLDFMKENDLIIGDPGIFNIKIEPVVDVIGLMDKIETSNRTLETIINEIEIEKDEKLFATDRFFKNYLYHKLTIEVSEQNGRAGIESLMNFINKQSYIQDLSREAKANYQARIAQNDSSITQINRIVKVYADAAEVANNTSSSLSFYNNPSSLELKEIFEYKTELTQENENLKNEAVGIDNAVVIVSSVELTKDEGLLDKNHLVYPFLFVFLFSIAVMTRYFYKRFKVKLQEENLID